MDSAKHVETSFWADFSKAAGVFILGEVYHGDPQYLMPYQKHMDGLLDYARYRLFPELLLSLRPSQHSAHALSLSLSSYYWITRAFQSPGGSISQLVNGLDTLRNSGTRRSGNGGIPPRL